MGFFYSRAGATKFLVYLLNIIPSPYGIFLFPRWRESYYMEFKNLKKGL